MTNPIIPLHAADLRVVLASLSRLAEAETTAGSYSDGLREDVERLLLDVDRLPNSNPSSKKLLSLSIELFKAGEIRAALLGADEALALKIPASF
ncbi:hypothetical protein [Burkholderia sp. PAMC 26561]|uniref:hypothetical protein n=1 Tax=Burkholderia sp. PAMC 26561 TaxID=1795043 RepID=UPI00076B4D62|nr:hypothetical protein [Burkholderia sp. PAMC 26561]AME26876.1 hypothetical protein AXG89_23075 [Burkholderia sp. PAMC 26561]AME27979.1 hypothetical protein AXG89_29605 [Burkholderia sp. PAMC 26561]